MLFSCWRPLALCVWDQEPIGVGDLPGCHATAPGDPHAAPDPLDQAQLLQSPDALGRGPAALPCQSRQCREGSRQEAASGLPGTPEHHVHQRGLVGCEQQLLAQLAHPRCQGAGLGWA